MKLSDISVTQLAPYIGVVQLHNASAIKWPIECLSLNIGLYAPHCLSLNIGLYAPLSAFFSTCQMPEK